MFKNIEKKDCVIPPIRVTSSEKLEVEMLAAASNKKVSSFILDTILNSKNELSSIDPKTLTVDYIKKYKDYLKSIATGSAIDDYKINNKISVIDDILIDILEIENKGGFNSMYMPKKKRGL